MKIEGFEGVIIPRRDRYGRTAWTNALFLNEIKQPDRGAARLFFEGSINLYKD